MFAKAVDDKGVVTRYCTREYSVEKRGAPMQRFFRARSSAKWPAKRLLLCLMSGLASGCTAKVSPPDPSNGGGAGVFDAGGGSGGLGSVESGGEMVGTRDAQSDAGWQIEDASMDDASLGFPCGLQARCVPRERCISCQRALLVYELLCVPDPDRDPNGYAAQTRDCASVRDFSDCDGPEDCASGEFCIVDDARGARCNSEPVLNPCWGCDLAKGTFCHVDEQCPVGMHCSGGIGYGENIFGCQ
jgi:hypothetical protein